MKLGIITLIILVGLMHQNDAGPIGHRFFKRASFYIANETACVVDNIVFLNGEPIPTEDPCETCRCRPPGFACTLHDCKIKPGCRAVRRDGYCCPEYVCGCEHDGRMYNHGDEIKNSLNPCTVCHCQGSSIACTHVDCIYRTDCAPEYVSGECCPRYTNCTSINDDKFLPTENEESSSEEPTSIIKSESTSSEENFSPDGTESDDGLLAIPNKDILVGGLFIPVEAKETKTEGPDILVGGPFILTDAEETETGGSVEKNEETDVTQDGENSPSSTEIDATDLNKDIALEKRVNNIFLNSAKDQNGEESMEETAKKEHEIGVLELDPEVITLSTEESDALEVATSGETAPFAGSPDASEDSTENIDVATKAQVTDETIDPEAKGKSMKLPEEEDISTDFVPEENFESITRDQSEEETSGAAILMEETLNSTTKLPVFKDDVLTESSETSSKRLEESTEKNEEITSQTKEPMNENNRVTEQFMDEVITNEEKKPRAGESEESVTLVVLVKDNDDQPTENPDGPKGEQPLGEESKPVEDGTVVVLYEGGGKLPELPVVLTDQSSEEVQNKETEFSVEEVDQPGEEAESPVRETEKSVEEVEQPVEEAEKQASETEMSVEVVELSGEKGEEETEEFSLSNERVNQPTTDDPLTSISPAEQENRYKALDEAILSAFVPDGASSVDESLDENMSLATEISKTAESEDTSVEPEVMVTFLPESTQFSEAEATAMIGVESITEHEQIQAVGEK